MTTTNMSVISGKHALILNQIEIYVVLIIGNMKVFLYKKKKEKKLSFLICLIKTFFCNQVWLAHSPLSFTSKTSSFILMTVWSSSVWVSVPDLAQSLHTLMRESCEQLANNSSSPEWDMERENLKICSLRSLKVTRSNTEYVAVKSPLKVEHYTTSNL